eukprot:TRINITY_DN1346_c0_g1_i1.p1 TRINITY_DN1346_c0_g1~~TRINITY_DN1346_c0_g1_i1.p1  ORF type:complete len:239 (-),score=48.68 TRINITY_DN1346_c0_g1_i1:137-757(-)
MASESASNFYVSVFGEICSARVSGASNLVIKYAYEYGVDWEFAKTSGEHVIIEEGVTQVSSPCSGPDPSFVFNFPVEVTFRSYNPYGWPQMIFSVYDLDRFGRERVKGYGRCFLPLYSGKHTLTVSLFRPVSSSPIQSIVSFLTGAGPEFTKPSFLAKSDGREVTRVEAEGSVTLKLNVCIRNMDQFGYAVQGEEVREEPHVMFRY